MRAIDLHSRGLIQRVGLTGPQLTILRAVVDAGELSVGDIARAVSLSQATVTGILQRLETKGLLARRRDTDDRRKVLLHCTTGALELLDRAPTPLQRHFLRRFDSLAEWERSQIISSLERVVAMMEAGEIDATPLLHTGPIEPTSALPT